MKRIASLLFSALLVLLLIWLAVRLIRSFAQINQMNRALVAAKRARLPQQLGDALAANVARYSGTADADA